MEIQRQRLILPDNVALRPVTDDDHFFFFLVDLHNDPEVLHNLTHPLSITLAQHVAWWDRISHDPRQLRLIFTVDKERAGFTKFYDIDRTNNNCVLGADIHKDFRGRGLARPMWELMLHACFENMGLHRVSLTTASYNNIGQRVYRGLGFREEGRLVQSLYRDGTYHDQICMFMLRDDWVKP